MSSSQGRWGRRGGGSSQDRGSSSSRGDGGSRGNREYLRDGDRGGRTRDNRGSDRTGDRRGDRGGYSGDRGDRGGSRGRGGSGGPGVDILRLQDGTVPAPDPATTNIEDQVASKSSDASLPDISRLSFAEHVPLRPGYGTKGQHVVLWTNHFQILPSADTLIFRYHVDIQPEVMAKKRERIVELLLGEGRISAYGSSLATDFKSTLLSLKEFEEDEQRDQIAYRVEGEDAPPQNATTYRIRLEPTGVFSMADVVNYLASTNITTAFEGKEEFEQALNIIVDHRAKAQRSDVTMSVRANRHFALRGSHAHRFDLRGGLQAWRGYLTSVRITASRILLNVQIKHAAAFQEGSLPSLIREFRSGSGLNLFKLETFLKRVKVEPNHLPERRNAAGQKIVRVKTIHGLARPNDGEAPNAPRVARHGAGPKQVEFFLGEKPPPSKKKGEKLQANQYISVHDFFRIAHSQTVNPDYPVINVGNRARPVYLPVDVCSVLPGQAAGTKLNPEQTAAMINFAVRKPFENARSITNESPVTLNINQGNSTLTQFGLVVNAQMITVNGRMLAPPNVRYSGATVVKPAHGSWNMRNIRFTVGANLRKWSVLWLRSQRHRDPWGDDTSAFRQTLSQFTQALNVNGVQAADPTPGPIVTVGGDDDDVAIDNAIHGILKKDKFEVLLVVLPKKDTSWYNQVKRCGDVKYGILTVCAVASVLAKNNLQTFANIALKFNTKLGGTNQTLDNDKLHIVDEGKTMVVGIDVTHPSPGSADRAPSVAAMVASTTKNLGQFPAVIYRQEARREMVADLSDMLKSRLALWRKHNQQRLPENILVYRDGVSESQYNQVIELELPLLRAACTEMYPANLRPAITIIIFGKRHNTRFYPTSTDDDKIDRSSNPRNGTVVDRGVTEPRNWDFYLQSHTAIQGTARPGHYFVVHDEIFSKRGVVKPPFKHAADVLEDLTHNMCYMFVRATKSISACPPAYYADLVCDRARCYLANLYDPSPGPTPGSSQIGGEGGRGGQQAADDIAGVHPNLRDTMFYI